MPATAVKSQWRNGYLVFYGKDGQTVAHFGPVATNTQQFKRLRVVTADVNAGKELLPALPGLCYQMTYMAMISYGGSAATVTTVDITGTQGASSVKLMAGAQASLTQSALIVAGATGGAILADGASFAVCDVNTAISASCTTNNLATSTGIDYLLGFVLLAG
jgi:hypothetical protein